MTRSETDDRATALGLLEELVGFDTTSNKTNLPLIDRVEDYLRGIGIDSVRVPNKKGDKAALFATIGPTGDGGIVLSGHTDVVPVAGQAWSSDPFVLRNADGRLYGRGTCDMKGFDAICLAMLPHFQRAQLKRPIHILLSYDEEIGCQGPLDTIARFGKDLPQPAIAIIGEPTEMGVVEAHKGISSYETTVIGKEAHSSNPEDGVSAIEIACQLVGELSRFQDKLIEEGDPSGQFAPAYSTVHVGKIEGGAARNILAKRCTFAWEFRPLPDIDPGRANAHLQAHIDRNVRPKLRRRAPDADVETLAHVEVPGLVADPGSPAETLAKRLTGTNRAGTVSFATEAGQFQRGGISSIVCGPGSIRQAHQPDEFIELSQIDAGLAFMHRLVAELS